MPPENRKKILILYTKVGDGHKSIAYALKDKLINHFGSNIEITTADSLNPYMDFSYQASTILSPRMFNLFYKVSKRPLVIKIWRELNSLLQDQKLEEVLEKDNPDLVISTHFLLTKEVKEILLREGKKTPVVVYIADPFSMHPVWFTHEIDLFLSFDLEHLPNGVYKSIYDKKTIPIGMPLRKHFLKKYDREKILKRLNLNPKKFTILFGGSGSGMDQLERIANPFRDLKLPCQSIFICGRNTVLKKALSVLFRNSKNIRILGTVTSKEMAEYMQSSDLLIGKAGPNVMFEAILSEVPIIATPPILGQELGNRKFIKSNDIGFLTVNSTQTVKLVKKIVDNPTILQKKRDKIKKIKDTLISVENNGLPKFVHWIEDNIFSKRISQTI